MAPSTDPSSLLTSWLQRDKKLVTYRLLSRELRIHVDEAKEALATFFDSHKDKSNLDATYILIGQSAALADAKSQDITTAQTTDDQQDEDKLVGSSSTPGSSTAPARSFLDARVTRRQTSADVARQVIRLVPADQVEEARSSMQQVTSCHIYSISPGRLRDAAQLTAVQHDLHTQQKYIDTWQQTNRGADLGVIVNPQIKDNHDPSKAIPSLGAASAPALGASKDTKQANNSTAKSQVKQEPESKTSLTTNAKSISAATAKPGGKKAGLDWSRAKSKENDAKPAAAAKNEALSSNKRSSARKALLGSDDEDDEDHNSSRKAILVDDDDDEDDGKPEKLGYADDESDDGDIKMTDSLRGAAPRGTGKRADARSQTKSQQAAQRKELEAMMDSDDDNDDVQIVEPSGATGSPKKTGQGKDLDPDVEMADSTVTDIMIGTGSAPAAAKRRVRKKRKIGSKKVRSKDERGYTVTKTVDEYESYSSEESDTPVVVGSKRGTAAAKQQPAAKETESRSTSTSASASPAPSAPAKAAPASNSSTLRKPSGGATPTPAKKGQQSLNSFFTRKPKDK